LDKNQTKTVMKIITNAGIVKNESMNALHNAKENNFEGANNGLEKAKEAMSKAHKEQTALLNREANNEEISINLLTIHSQDHLMNAITIYELVQEIILIIKR